MAILFDMVSFFNDINIRGLFYAKAILVGELQRYYRTYSNWISIAFQMVLARK